MMLCCVDYCTNNQRTHETARRNIMRIGQHWMTTTWLRGNRLTMINFDIYWVLFSRHIFFSISIRTDGCIRRPCYRLVWSRMLQESLFKCSIYAIRKPLIESRLCTCRADDVDNGLFICWAASMKKWMRGVFDFEDMVARVWRLSELMAWVKSTVWPNLPSRVLNTIGKPLQHNPCNGFVCLPTLSFMWEWYKHSTTLNIFSSTAQLPHYSSKLKRPVGAQVIWCKRARYLYIKIIMIAFDRQKKNFNMVCRLLYFTPNFALAWTPNIVE